MHSCSLDECLVPQRTRMTFCCCSWALLPSSRTAPNDIYLQVAIDGLTWSSCRWYCLCPCWITEMSLMTPEARSRSPATSIPSIPSKGRNSDFRVNRRSIHSFKWSRTTHCEEAEGKLVGRSNHHQVPQQQDDRELQGQAAERPSSDKMQCNAGWV